MKDCHTPFKRIVFLGVTLLLLGCSEAYKVPNQSVFEPLNARQMKRALKAPFFDEFYSDYSHYINKCKDSEKFCFADITWRNLYRYSDARRVSWDYDDYTGKLKDSRSFFYYLNKCERNWNEKYGQYDSMIDSIVTQGEETLKNYFNQIVNVEFLKTERSVLCRGNKKRERSIYVIPSFSDLEDEIIFSFRLIPLSDSIRKCRFYFLERKMSGHLSPKDSLQFSICQPLSSSYEQTWKRCYTYGSNIKPISDDSMKKWEVIVTDVCLSNGKEYSISDLTLPKSVKDYYLGEVSRDEERKGVFYDALGYPYICYYQYMKDAEDDWIHSKFPREMYFDKMLRDLN